MMVMVCEMMYIVATHSPHNFDDRLSLNRQRVLSKLVLWLDLKLNLLSYSRMSWNLVENIGLTSASDITTYIVTTLEVHYVLNVSHRLSSFSETFRFGLIIPMFNYILPLVSHGTMPDMRKILL